MTLFAEVTTVVKLENIGKNTKKYLKSKYSPNDLFFHFLLMDSSIKSVNLERIELETKYRISI